MTTEKENENNGNESGQRLPTDTRSSGGRIRSFPQGYSKHSGLSAGVPNSKQNDVRVDGGSGGLSETGKTSPASDTKGSGKHSVERDGIVERVDRGSQQSDRGVRNSTTNNSNNATGQEAVGATRTRIGNGGKTVVRKLLQEQLDETPRQGASIPVDTSGDSPASSVLDIDTRSSFKLSEDVEIIPTRMLEREIERNQSADNEIELSDDVRITSAPPLPKKKGRPSTKNSPIKTEDATTTVIPAKPFKFEKEIRQQLNEVIEYAFTTLDLLVDYGLGVDTSQVDIWALGDGEADVFVRILERRAARSAFVRDTIVPKMLQGRDYLEAGMIVAPRAITTVKQIVENGGIKPHIVHKKEEA